MTGLSHAARKTVLASKAEGAWRSKGIGLCVMILAPIAAVGLFWVIWNHINDMNLIILAAAGLFGVASWSVESGRRLRLPDGWDILERDKRHPVVFLRPFTEDDRVNYDGPLGERTGSITGGPTPKGNATVEPKLTAVLEQIGPFLAVGRPGQRLAPFGAHRLYMTHECWKNAVAALVAESAAVVLQPERTPSTYWELEFAAKTLDPRRILMLVPNPTKRPLGYFRVRALVGAHMPLPLPAEIGDYDGFMFDAEGRPTPINFSTELTASLASFVNQIRGLPNPYPG